MSDKQAISEAGKHSALSTGNLRTFEPANLRTERGALSGIVNIDKPAGMTSHDVVAQVRRITRQKKVGHAGTLDPLATGVLPVLLGKATRLVEYLSDADKAYKATIVLGANTDTYDREGVLMPVPDAPTPSQEEVEAALSTFRGQIEQLPPMHSALKVGGKKLYELARAGVEIERKPRPITIRRLELEAYEPPALAIFVECSKGTYIRSLAYDLGAKLGTGAYLDALVRTRHGPFTTEQATTLDGLAAAFENDTWQECIYPPEYIVEDWPTYVPTAEEARDISQGKPLHRQEPGPGTRPMLAARTTTGDLLAILYWDTDKEHWQPHKVFVTFERPNVATF